MRVISNTTPLLALSSVDRLDLLKEIYQEVFIPGAVLQEIQHGGAIKLIGLDKIQWIKVIPDIISEDSNLLFQLDAGELQVVLNGLKYNPDLILIDDRVARNTAEYLGLRVKGTLGVLVEAKRNGLIKSFKECAHEMREQGIYFAEKLIDEISKTIDLH